jgi:sorting nexin-29
MVQWRNLGSKGTFKTGPSDNAKVKCSVRIQSHLSKSLNVKNGLRQGDALACLLFNTTLENVVHESNIQTRGTIFSKTTQILAYADDIDIMCRTMMGLKESFISFEKSAHRMGLVINQEKMV